jgi:hypothetical protein
MKKYSFFSKEYSITKCLFIALYALIILIGIYLPIQTDEISWSIPNHRGIIDNFKITTLFPQCLTPNSYTKDLPILWYPYAFINNLLFMQIESHLWIRIVGTIRFLLFIILIWFILKPLSLKNNTKPINFFLLFISLLSLDELPLSIQVNRPEQSLLLATTFFLALYLNSEQIIKNRLLKTASIIISILTVLSTFPSHPKAITILPIILVCSSFFYFKVTKSKFKTTLICSLFALFSLYSAYVWANRVSCPNSEDARTMFANHYVPFQLLLNQPYEFLKKILLIFFQALLFDFNVSIFLFTRTDWIPKSLSSLPISLEILQYILFAISYTLRIILFLALTIFSIGLIIKFLNIKKRENLNNDKIIIISIFTTVIGLMLISGETRMRYLVSLQTPLLLILFFLFYDKFKFIKLKQLTSVIFIIALINLSFLSYRYIDYAISNKDYTSKIDKHLFVLISALNSQKKKELINASFKSCFTENKNYKLKKLVLDDFTYPYLKNTKEPFLFNYVSEIGFKGSDAYNNDKFYKFLSDFKSEGVFIDCRTAPDELKINMKQSNGYCCLNLKDKEK